MSARLPPRPAAALAGIILAAGNSSRMGTPKALLQFEGETFLDRLIGIFGRVCRHTIVVLGHHAESIQLKLARQAAFVRNPDPDRGQLTSLQCGLRAVPAGMDGVMFTPLDYPAIETETVERLVESFSGSRAAIALAIPRCQHRRGHPVVVRAALIAEFLALPETASARDVVRRHDAAIRYVEVRDTGILTDVDTPEDYRRLLERKGLARP
ncbi:MAG: nucleotidyltransferase family protein [Bryobacteraceae bacterium]